MIYLTPKFIRGFFIGNTRKECFKKVGVCMNQEVIDQQYMERAIALAERGRGYTSPNPLVGCVVVKDGKIIGEGWHKRYGEYHAERHALSDLTPEATTGATIYVTLEPCCHHGNNPV